MMNIQYIYDIAKSTIKIIQQHLLLAYHILQVLIFPQASICSYSSPACWTLGSTFPNTFFGTSTAETVKAFGYDMWIGEGIKTYGTLKLLLTKDVSVDRAELR